MVADSSLPAVDWLYWNILADAVSEIIFFESADDAWIEASAQMGRLLEHPHKRLFCDRANASQHGYKSCSGWAAVSNSAKSQGTR
ncbi:unnamed protein product, partial [Protopolystoma xenopodis]